MKKFYLKEDGVFDLKKIFAVPKDFLKSKIYCNSVVCNAGMPEGEL